MNYNFQFPESTEATVEVDAGIEHLESCLCFTVVNSLKLDFIHDNVVCLAITVLWITVLFWFHLICPLLITIKVATFRRLISNIINVEKHFELKE